MKFTLYACFLFFLFFTTSLKSQVIVEGVNINELDEIVYCQVVAFGKIFSNKVKINIDYGQEQKFFGKQNSRVTNINGKQIKFNSLFAAVNHMGKNGWKFVHAYPLTMQGGLGGSQNVYHYTFEKDGSFQN
ncbi:MAG: hypothetical protein ACJA01_003081 [Saprospiraceae bacterium]|jgi:hypothetical protein